MYICLNICMCICIYDGGKTKHLGKTRFIPLDQLVFHSAPLPNKEHFAIKYIINYKKSYQMKFW